MPVDLEHATARKSRESDPVVGRAALVSLLSIQMFIGYEWLMSGAAKLVRGGFASGLEDELREKSAGVAGWYQSFIDSVVLPNARLFGYLIEVAELMVGATLLLVAIVWIWRGDRLSTRARRPLLIAILVAASSAVVMNANFHFANGSAHPWLIPEDGFDEGVDLDSLMPLIEIVLIVFAARLLALSRAAHEPQRRSVPTGQ